MSRMNRGTRRVGFLFAMFLISAGTAWPGQLPLGQRPSAGRVAAAPPSGMSRREFVEVLAEFREAVSQYREALGQEQGLEKKAKEIQKHIGDLTDFIKATDVKAVEFDETEFTDFSSKDLAWETLTTAERTDNDLRLALKVLDAAERENVITIQALQFFRVVLTDLQRLKWLTARVAERFPQEPARR